ncbi:MAG: hypothetical protein HYV93_01835 [Candidatus Rokubacteria bacterium]|nr:hypothetical protein [Candidatus Rokubacteria bacterium]
MTAPSRTTQRPARAAFRWAADALRRELVAFRFDYPVEVVPGAAHAGSLHYHVRSAGLFADAMQLDSAGVPLHRARTFTTYNAAYVAWYGLARLDRFLAGHEPDGREAFLRQVRWLAAHAVRRDDGAVMWPLTIDWQEGACRLVPPWISAMSQGLAISALVRAHRLSGDPLLLTVARDASAVFDKSVEDGGLRTLVAGHALYEEYPAYPLPRVLDGFLFGLLGLYDLSVSGDARAGQLFADGVAGLVRTVPFWDYRGAWSWYGAHGYLCPPHYHRLNTALLAVVGALAGESALLRRARAWGAAPRSARERAEIFLVFVLTKNWARLRFAWQRTRGR